MMNNIATKLFALDSFKREYKNVLYNAVYTAFPNIDNADKNDISNKVDWNNLLSIASFLQQSNNREHLDAALRIAQQCISSPSALANQKSAAVIVLESLTNKSAIRLAMDRKLISENHIKSIPLPFELEIIKRDFDHSILSDNNQGLIYLNRFQKEVYEHHQESNYLSISAPTSAGKSFILSRIIKEEILETEHPITLIYLVPTRALIGQVEEEFRYLVKSGNIKNVSISSVPQLSDEDLNKTNIYIFTQERLHWFRAEHPLQKISFLIVDEAQKIEDGTRGVLLQQKIEELVNDFPDIKVYFSSPFTENPEELLKILPKERKGESVKTEFVAVNQNLIFVSQIPRYPKKWEVSICLENSVDVLGEIELKFRPAPKSKRFPLIVENLASKSGGNIIYANGAYEAERIATQLKDILDSSYEAVSKDVKELIKLVKKSVHKKYALADVLEKKIAFHYGNMPLLIRQEIERLFAKGEIHFIICTSTLLEGVNLPAKNIFILNPKRGNSTPMNMTDFWNLAGRAGRLGKEFEGNIICVSPNEWDIKPTYKRTEQKIKKAVDEIHENNKKLLDYIKNGTPRGEANREPSLEYGFTYYYSKYLTGTFTPIDDTDKELQSEFEKISREIKIPKEIILKNPGISPIAQSELYEYFEKKQDEINEVIPILPESENAVDLCYVRLVGNIQKYLSGDAFGRQYYLAILVVNWMNGYRLYNLIDSNYKYWTSEKVKEKKKLNTVIRDTMRDVEEFARFKFAKYSGCYIDVLRFYLESTGQHKLLEEIPDLSMWLEFGVSQQTQISLIGIGLSRNTAIVISEFIGNDNLSKSEVIVWLRNNDFEKLDISEIIVREIQNVLQVLN